HASLGIKATTRVSNYLVLLSRAFQVIQRTTVPPYSRWLFSTSNIVIVWAGFRHIQGPLASDSGRVKRRHCRLPSEYPRPKGFEKTYSTNSPDGRRLPYRRPGHSCSFYHNT